ncbi:hypothetical protein K490DRAFT_69769 [Saccharata proteae CBS 121410]|uniref:BTB domain-containing protein n=1 Tax=Saccharata proteae CBS 121410 TaxID=1314787 RepID=A0A9P4HKY1_9PEZI|nr:hypothetical protein K490DRAFT_69769 [Saccharata proteae CBS 121410]
MIKAMLEYMYSHNHATPALHEYESLTFHAQMHATADYHNVPGLKTLSASKFGAAARYNRPLRDIAVEVAIEICCSVDERKITYARLVDTVPDFAKDYVDPLCRYKIVNEQYYQRPGCSARVSSPELDKFARDRKVECPGRFESRCNEAFVKAIWQEFEVE